MATRTYTKEQLGHQHYEAGTYDVIGEYNDVWQGVPVNVVLCRPSGVDPSRCRKHIFVTYPDGSARFRFTD